MDEIKVPERLNRIARDLSRLPPELREPILSQLNFADIVRLAVAPAASSSLNQSIRYSDEWKWLFEDKLESIKASWIALDEICWLWCHRTWLALWRARTLIQKGTKSIFSFSSKELNDGGYRYWNEEPSWDPSDRSGPDNAERPDTIEADLRGLALTLFSVFIGANHDTAERHYTRYLNLKYGESFNLTLWKRHRSLGVLERRAISLFLPGAVRDALLSGDPLPHEFESHQTWEQFMANAPTEEALTLCAGALASRVWTYEEIFQVLPIFHTALSMLNQAQSAELNSLANLYERYPELLKEPQAPNSPRRNTHHILNQLRQDADQAQKRPAFISRKTLAEPNPNRASGAVMLANYRFRHSHLPLIPYNWCIHLFHAIINRHPIKGAKEASMYPPELLPKLELAVAGFHNVHTHGETAESPRTRRISTATPNDPYYLIQLNTVDGCPKPLAEIRWLVAFTECVDWMRQHFKKDVAYAQRVCFSVEPAAQVIKYKNTVLSWSDYEQLVQTISPRDIARHLLLDSEVCDNTGKRYDGVLPSLLALHVPAFESQLGRAIGHHLVQGKGQIGHDATRIYYESLVQKITYHIQYPKLGEPTASIYRRWIPKRTATAAGPSQHIHDDTEHEASAERNEDTLQAALRIAQQLKALDLGETDALTAATAMSALEKLIDLQSRHEAKPRVQPQSWEDVEKAYHDSLCVEAAQKPAQRAIIRCYICRFTCTQQHAVFPSMCVPCGDFNIAGSEFTKNPSVLPPDECKVAVITGGRVNLGFHLALHFLKQGFRVIVTTRYPQDARDRYNRFFRNKGREHARNHLGNLRIIGADFRTSVDVFAAVQSIKAILAEWRERWWCRQTRLYFLINNAAQTLTDSIAKETVAIEKEALLAEQYVGKGLLEENGYVARVRGSTTARLGGTSPTIEENERPKLISSTKASESGRELSSVPAAAPPSSWVQQLSDIPYEDFISAHSVNAFAPLILIRELAPYMSPRYGEGGATTRGLHGHIVNVSSREGIFEARRGNTAKRGRHVHTNMSKAGLNMITETEAENMWKERGIAMNTVDPGYMSAAPECESLFNGERPIGWEDGASRVLWPIYQMEAKYKDKDKSKDYEKYWGRFFKHYGAVRVEPRFGRG